MGGTAVPAYHFRQVRTLSGNQTGTQSADLWFAVNDGLPLRNERQVTVHTDTVIGSSTYTETRQLRAHVAGAAALTEWPAAHSTKRKVLGRFIARRRRMFSKGASAAAASPIATVSRYDAGVTACWTARSGTAEGNTVSRIQSQERGAEAEAQRDPDQAEQHALRHRHERDDADAHAERRTSSRARAPVPRRRCGWR